MFILREQDCGRQPTFSPTLSLCTYELDLDWHVAYFQRATVEELV